MPETYESTLLYKKGTIEILSRLIQSDEPVRFTELKSVSNNSLKS